MRRYGKHTREGRRWARWLLLALLGGAAGPAAAAFKLILDELSNGYSGCSAVNNGDTTSFYVTISYKEAAGHLGGPKAQFVSRGVLIYTYDEKGSPLTGRNAERVFLNTSRTTVNSPGVGYYMWYGQGVWATKEPLIADIEAVVSNKLLEKWPAVGIQAGNLTYGDDVGELKGAAYISTDSSSGHCRLITDPIQPPPLQPRVTVALPPVWEIGELQAGEQTTELSRSDQQFCLHYPGNSGLLVGDRLLIGAEALNGRGNSRYHLLGSSQGGDVPYRLLLRDALDSNNAITLPEASGGSVPTRLSGASHTCFTPSIISEVAGDTPTDAYTDQLNLKITMMP